MQRKAEPARVLIYKKRTGELVTRDDPEGRRTVFRKLPKIGSGRWIAIGRLDINTSGLLLFTNHGELARRPTHPSFDVPRTYAVRVRSEEHTSELQSLMRIAYAVFSLINKHDHSVNIIEPRDQHP